MIYHQKSFISSIVNLPVYLAICAFLIGLLFSLLYLVYLPYKYNGQTIGKKIFGLKIIRDDENNIDLKTLFIRNRIRLILIEGIFYSCSIYFWELINIMFKTSISSVILSILSLLNSNHCMLHDYLSKTCVVTMQK